jgi:hypothetical protein
MILVMRDVTELAKSDKNRQQGFSFRGIDSVLNVVGPSFRQHGIGLEVEVTDLTYNTVEIGQRRTPMAHVLAHVDYRFYAGEDAKEVIQCTVVGEAMDSGDKAVSKAMSVALRTALLQVLVLPTGEPDPDSYNYERSEPEAPQAERDEQAEVRQAIIDWAGQNDKNIRQVAEIFASNYHHPITEATTDELKEFYVKLSLGGKAESEARGEVTQAEQGELS